VLLLVRLRLWAMQQRPGGPCPLLLHRLTPSNFALTYQKTRFPSCHFP